MYLQKDLKHILIPAGSSILDPFQYFLKFSNSSHIEGNTIFLKDTLILIEDISDILEVVNSSLVLKQGLFSSLELHFPLDFCVVQNINLLSFITRYLPKYNSIFLSKDEIKTTYFFNQNNSIVVSNYFPNKETDGMLDLSLPLPLNKLKYYFFYRFMKDLIVNKLKLPLCTVYYYYDRYNKLRFRLHNSKFALKFLDYYFHNYNFNRDCQYFPEIIFDFPYQYAGDKDLFLKLLKMHGNDSMIYFNNKNNSFLYVIS